MKINDKNYHSLFKKMGLGVVFQDFNGNITDANPAAEKILGYSMKEMQGMNSFSKQWQAVKEDGSEFSGHEHPAMIALKSGKEVKDVVMGIIHPKEKKRVWIKIDAFPEFKEASDKAYRVFTTFFDITHNIQLKQLSVSTRQEMKKTLQKLPAHIFRFKKGKEGKVIAVVSEGRIATANKITTSEIYGKTLKDIVSPENHQVMKYYYDRAFEGENVDFEIAINKIWYRTRLTPFAKDSDGNVIEIVGYTVDINYRKFAEESLKASENKYRQLTEEINDIIWEVDVDGICTYMSPKIKDVLGFSPAEVLGKSPFDIMNKKESERVKEAFLKIVEQEKTFENLENTVIAKDGKNVILSTSGAPVFDKNGTLTGYRGIDRDITVRKKAEKEKHESLRRLEVLMDNLPGMAYRCLNDHQWTMTFVSNGSLELTGYKASALTNNKEISYGDIIHPDDKDLVWSSVQNSIDKKIPFEIEYRIIKADGTNKYVWERGMGIFNENGYFFIEGFITDINERKLAEQALRESKERFKLAIEGTRDGLWDWNLITNEAYHSEQFAKMLGYEPGELPYTSDAWSALIHPDDKKAALKRVDEYLSNQTGHYESTFRMRTKDGSYRWITGRGKCLKDDNGKPKRFVGFNTDITERKKVEKELRKSQEFLSIVYQHSDIGVFVVQVQKNGEFIYEGINPAHEKLLGIGNSEIINKKPSDLTDKLGKESVEYLYSIYNECVETKKVVESEFYIPSGLAKGYWLTRLAPVFDDKEKDVEKLIGSAMLITELKEAQKALKENETYLKGVFNGIGIAVFVVDVIGERFLFSSVNKGYYQIMYRFGIEDFTGKFLDELDNVLPATVINSAKDQYKKCAETGNTIEYDEKGPSAKGKDTFWLTRLTPMKDNNGKVYRIIGSTLDITERKHAEQLKNDMQIAERTAKLKEQFLANMSHEMRTPMTGIIGMTEFLQDTNLSLQQKEYVDVIKNSSESLLFLINDILDISKIERGKMDMNPATINIVDTMNNIVNIFSGQVKQKNLNLIIDLDKNFPEYISIDENRFKQVASNLLSNAVKYTRKGYIKLKLSTISIENSFVRGKINVIDTGIGINKDDLGKIFQVFSRIDDSYTRKTEGSGLGLHISKQLAKLMQGDIGVESIEGKGSNFWFTFQAEIKTGIPKTTSKIIKEEEVINKHLHILLAEDKFVNQQVITMMLKTLGCTVVVAKNGLEVLEKFKSDTFNIILMDIMMPEMDGITAMNKLKEKYRNLPPIIGLSAHAMEGDAEKFIEMGMDDYIEKPLKKETLLLKLKKWSCR